MLSISDNEWSSLLKNEFDKPYFKDINTFLDQESKKDIVFFPNKENIFTAFNLSPFSKVKVVILGQDPYHGQNQAHGLSFSVQSGKIPPSLQNIYKAIKLDISSYEIPKNGDLTHWAKQGILLLNATLTVEANKAGSHQNIGWENFTDKVISILSSQKENLIFMLWGKFAQKKANLIDIKKHLILTAPHPSPFSAYNGFFDCKHFSKANKFLIENEKEPINW
ncbi:MAG: uracil-DNA glycosylase [Sphingobacteriaceae bacterium]|nr:uracil-DNA glycosylase [Sphingobacteriaceae bacterium]